MIAMMIAFASVNSIFAQTEPSQRMTNQSMISNQVRFHDYRVKTINGEDFNLNSLKGKRVLVVNTASECGQTPQYAQLQELYEMYGGENFTIIGFPSNDFGAQEPGSDSEIATFCQKNYGVTFPMMSKISVKGESQHPLYQWLTQKDRNKVQDVEITWNFDKFLIDENGNWIAHLPSKRSPLDDAVIKFASGEK
jgi:glutathione peroxidase